MLTPCNRVIGTAGIIAAPDGFAVELRLPWYRSLPLSTVEIETVEIDGNAVAPERVTFELEGKRYALSELEEQVDHVWYVLDSAWLHIMASDLSVGEHEVALVLTTYPPYIHGLKRPVRDSKAFSFPMEAAHV